MACEEDVDLVLDTELEEETNVVVEELDTRSEELDFVEDTEEELVLVDIEESTDEELLFVDETDDATDDELDLVEDEGTLETEVDFEEDDETTDTEVDLLELEVTDVVVETGFVVELESIVVDLLDEDDDVDLEEDTGTEELLLLEETDRLDVDVDVLTEETLVELDTDFDVDVEGTDFEVDVVTIDRLVVDVFVVDTDLEVDVEVTDFEVDVDLTEDEALVADVLTTAIVPYCHTLSRYEPPHVSVALPLQAMLQPTSPSDARVPPLEKALPQSIQLAIGLHHVLYRG